MPRRAWLIRSNPNASGSVTAHRAAGGRQDFGGRRFLPASAASRVDASPGSIPRLAWLIHSTRTLTMRSIQSRCRRMGRFSWAAVSAASADSRAISSPDWIPRLAWPIHSTRMRTILSVPVAVQADGRIVVGGLFSTIGGQSRNRIARLDPTTGLADSFNPNAGDQVDSIAIQADGKILGGGAFTSIGGQTRLTWPAWKRTAGSTKRSISTCPPGRCLCHCRAAGRQDSHRWLL